MIQVEYQNEIALVRLNQPITNALDLQLLTELAQTLREVKQDSNVRGLVLSSSNTKFFSIGFDIPQLFKLARQDFRIFYRTFNQICVDLYTLPKPTLAAITGHAIAGGCVLALCCDYRFIAAGHKLMGLNEIKLGVPVPYLADCILQRMVGMQDARDMLNGGDFYPPERLLQMGMVDQVLPLDQVVPESIKKTEALGTMPQAAFAMIKQNRVEMIDARVLARREEKERFFVECWYSAQARERLKEAMEKF